MGPTNTIAPVYSRSIYPRNARAKSGKMTNASDGGRKKYDPVKNEKKNHVKSKPSAVNVLTDLEIMEEQVIKKMKTLNAAENRFTIPSSPNNVNVVVSTIRRQRSAHSEVMKNISKAEDSAGNVEIVQ